MTSDLQEWLSAIGLSDYAEAFRENRIDLAILPDLTAEDLKEIGVTAVGDRRRILRAADALRKDDVAAPTAAERVAAVPESAKRQVTVMFVDLSGFTGLSSQMDPEDAHALLNTFFATTDRIVKKYGGRIDKHIGDAVMAVFGAPISQTNDTERAALAALDIHADIARLDPPLSCHIGIASGQVIASRTGSEAHVEYTITGDGVNLASRLTDLAEPGETIVSHDIQRALGPLFVGTSLGTQLLKGLNSPIEIWRLTKVTRNMRSRRNQFIGRDREMALFSAVFDRCHTHENGEVHVLLGEPGIGKTHLAEEVCALAASRSYAVHQSVVMDFGTQEGQSATQALVQSLLGLSATDDAPTRASVAGQTVAKGWVDPENEAHLRALLNVAQEAGASEVYAQMDNATRLRGRKSVLTNLIATCCKNAPMLILIEDIHWAPKEILSDCSVIAAAIHELPCVLLMTSRAAEDPVDLDWQSQAEGTPLSKLEISALKEDQARLLVNSFAKIDPVIGEICVQRAGGNPLFLEQLLRNADALEPGTVPGSIQAIVQARLDGLDPDSRLALQAASVLGQRFSIEALRSLLDSHDLPPSLLTRSALVKEQGNDYLFGHALIRDGAYATLIKSRRNQLHQRAAEWFADKDLTLRAVHLDRAGDTDAPQAYLEAAEKQKASYQFDKAIALFRTALDLPSSPDLHFDLLCALSETLRLQGASAEAMQGFDDAAALAGSDEDISRAHIGRAQSARQLSLYDDALKSLAIAEAAAERAGLARSVAEINYIRGNVYFPLGRFKESMQSNERVLRYARKAGSARLEVGALSGFGDANFLSGSMTSAAQYYAQAIDLARDNGMVRNLAANLHNRSISRSYSGELRQGKADAEEAITISQTYFALVPESVAQTCLGVAGTFLGELDETLAVFVKSAELAERVGAKRLEAQALEHLARTQVYTGKLAEARETGQRAKVLSLEHARNFVGPKALSACALSLEDPEEQDHLIAQGARIIAEGCVGHSHLHYYADAIVMMLNREDWAAALGFAGALEAFTEKEPLAMVSLTIAQARLLVACGRSGTAPGQHADFEGISQRLETMGAVHTLLGPVASWYAAPAGTAPAHLA